MLRKRKDIGRHIFLMRDLIRCLRQEEGNGASIISIGDYKQKGESNERSGLKIVSSG